MKTLVTFLGRPHRNRAYDAVTYQFPDGRPRTSVFFGLLLADYLEADRLLVLGTAGSNWDVLLEHHIQDSEDEEARLALIAACDQSQVTPALLDRIAPLLTRRTNRRTELCLIPDGLNDGEQAAIVTLLSNRLQAGEGVAFDVTHSFRHLPLLALAAAMYLETVLGVQVGEIAYGLLDGDRSQAVMLTGLLQTLRWTQALDLFRQTGMSRPLGGLLAREGLENKARQRLESMDFAVSTLQSENARDAIRGFRPALKQLQSPWFSLFQDKWLAELQWADLIHRDQRELALAKKAGQARDYLRAVAWLMEGLISRALRGHPQIMEYSIRENAKNTLTRDPAFAKLSKLRNQLVHGQNRSAARDHSTIAPLLAAEQNLRLQIEQWLRDLPAQIAPGKLKAIGS